MDQISLSGADVWAGRLRRRHSKQLHGVGYSCIEIPVCSPLSQVQKAARKRTNRSSEQERRERGGERRERVCGVFFFVGKDIECVCFMQETACVIASVHVHACAVMFSAGDV